MADKSGKSTKKSGLALACILLAVLLIFIFFLVKKDSILTNLKETRFFERVFGSTPEFVENHKPSEKDEVKIPLNEKSDDQISIKIEPESSAAKPKQETQAQKTQDSVAKNDADSEKAQDSTKKTAEKIETPAKTTGTTDLYLCFVEIDPDGSIIRKLIKRTVPKTDSPLSAAINLVLQGPDTTQAEERNCTTLIPYGTKLLGARVTDGVAYLDFNDNFEINTNGVEGYNGQLMQLVYTATSFSTVNSVQFLVEGKKKEYLGSEGQWIGSPLSRNSF